MWQRSADVAAGTAVLAAPYAARGPDVGVRPVARGPRPVAADEPQRLFRSVFAQLPSGVTVLTTVGPDGPTGMTASSVTSLSLDPLLVLACASTASATLAAISRRGAFGVNVLDEHGQALAAAFARRCHPGEKFAGVRYGVRHGVPVLDDALAWVTCDVTATHPGGDHTILVGAVTGMHRADGEPLVWHDGRYRALT